MLRPAKSKEESLIRITYIKRETQTITPSPSPPSTGANHQTVTEKRREEGKGEGKIASRQGYPAPDGSSCTPTWIEGHEVTFIENELDIELVEADDPTGLYLQ